MSEQDQEAVNFNKRMTRREFENMTRQKKAKYKKWVEAKRIEWNVPGWKDKSGYPSGDEGLTPDAWRWEFLRRNENYRQDWALKQVMPLSYGMREWISPAQGAPPKFYRDQGEILSFMETDSHLKELHYDALAEVTAGNALVCQIDLYRPLKPQLKAITDEYEARRERNLPEKPTHRPGRKNNRTEKKSRSRASLLRILDAYNEYLPVGVIADSHDLFRTEEVSEAAARYSIDFAMDFWRRL